MSRDGRLIRCGYGAREPGLYLVDVRWSGRHVSGSPFRVPVADTRQELERYLHWLRWRRKKV